MSGFYRRLVLVTVRLLPFAVAFLRDRRRFVLFGGGRQLARGRHRRRAERLTRTFVDLGPAFVKAGQVLSTRPDVVPPVYAEAFSSLQDEVPEDTSRDPGTVLEADLEAPVSDLEPVAGGSLAYVYAGRLDDERVALKIRRPGIVPKIERDLRVIRTLLSVLGPFVDERYRYSLRNIADDFERIILDELDFEREARMMEHIRTNLADDDRVYVPRVDRTLTTERVLVMEHVTGERITDRDALERAAVDPSELADRITEVYLRMGLSHGVFHADPHPGNLAIQPDGTLVIYDFGMSEALSSETQRRLTDLYRALARRDVDALVDVLVALDVLESSVDRAAVRTVLRLAMENLEGRSDLGWRDLTDELFEALREFPFRIPPNVMLLIRVGTVAEGVCRQLDPEFDFVAAARSFLLEEGLYEFDVEALLRDISTDLRGAAPALVRLPTRLDRVLDRIENGSLRVRTDAETASSRSQGYAVLAGTCIVATAILAFHPRPYEVLTLVAALLALVGFRRAR